MIEKYLTVLSILIVSHGFCIFPYVFIMRKTRFAHKGRSFILNKLFGSYSKNTWIIFWLSVLWIIVYFFDFIRNFING